METLNNIRQFMLWYLHKKCPGYSQISAYYNRYDHSSELYNKIYSFWNTFNKESVKYLISGIYENYGELDLTGERHFSVNFLPEEELAEMLIHYVYDELGYDKETFYDQICNSTILNEMLYNMYDDIHIIRDIKLKKLLKNVL